MNNLQLRQILMEIQSNLRCMHCGKTYRADNIHLRGSFKNMYLFQLICEGHASFATITVIGQQTKIKAHSIDINDVLAFHQELSTFDGDFKKVFK